MVKELTISRDKELRKRFNNILDSGVNRDYYDWHFIVKFLAGQPAPRFYISPKKAENYVLNYLRGKYILKAPKSMEMIKDLAENYQRIKLENPHMRQWQVWDLLVEQPAKSFYLGEDQIKRIVYEYERKTKTNVGDNT